MAKITSKKRTCLVTLPLVGNYGGNLQAYALYQVLNKENPNTFYVKTQRISHNRVILFIYDFVGSVCDLVLQLFKRKIINRKPLVDSLFFIRRFFPKRLPDYSSAEVLVIGSDQVWRKEYYRKQSYFFASRTTQYVRNHSIAYAASFGTDEWGGTAEEAELCGKLLRQFKAVSVREYSGINICRSAFGVEAVRMPDPTLLASLDDYEQVIQSERTRCLEQAYFASYVLDPTDDTLALMDAVEREMGLYHQTLMPQTKARYWRDRLSCTAAQWLRYVRDSAALVTDSYHGCVFAIIYNKPFVCLGNQTRGAARFDTLFEIFGLRDRLVMSRNPDEILQVLRAPIDWVSVNAIHEAERRRGLDFLRCNLNSEEGIL